MNMTKSRSGLVAVYRLPLKEGIGTQDHHTIESDLSPLRVTQLPLSTSPFNRSVPSDDDETDARHFSSNTCFITLYT